MRVQITFLNVIILTLGIYRCTPTEESKRESVTQHVQLMNSDSVIVSAKYITIQDTIVHFMDTSIVDTTVRLDDSSYFLIFNLAQNSVVNNKYKLHIEYLEYLEIIKPRDAFIHNSLGFAYQRKGDENEAIRYFRRALVLADSLVHVFEKRDNVETTYFYELQKANAAKMVLLGDSADELIQSIIEKYPDTFFTNDLKQIKDMSQDEFLKSMN